MKLSVSNIAWTDWQDGSIYREMKKYGYSGLEIAPTRWFPKAPYDHVKQAQEIYRQLKQEYALHISSMQSIWYGRSENIWGTSEERKILEKYTEKAIGFAASIECRNLVFGCPKNRNRVEKTDEAEIISWFRKLGHYADVYHVILAIEANPPIYRTNYINRTREAVNLIRRLECAGIGLNLDIGTMIENGEGLDDLEEAWSYICHVHISEPLLKPIERRSLHKELAAALREHDYSGYVSIEMGKQDNLQVLEETMGYVAEVFG